MLWFFLVVLTPENLTFHSTHATSWRRSLKVDTDTEGHVTTNLTFCVWSLKTDIYFHSACFVVYIVRTNNNNRICWSSSRGGGGGGGAGEASESAGIGCREYSLTLMNISFIRI
ncbi:hypothetical protein JOB18_037655 [Solea senegalensis]|uniref:Secreted protein n=1 Tax=Solea senegalensis TaxID=28829 RepID=A0AAV6SND6_SOLSE|nr:hypothetical protein JOB18_037655 [Solea senegalensis]